MRIPVQIEKADRSELLSLIEEICSEYVNEAQKCAYVSAETEIQNMLSDKSLNQFLAVCKAIAITLKGMDIEYIEIFGTEDKIDELSRRMQCWIILGSATETALQIFLAIYLADYNNSSWKQWQNFNYEEVKSSFFNILDEAVVNGHIEQQNAKSLKNGIKKQLQSKINMPTIYKLTLKELVNFYNRQVGWDKEMIDNLDFIRKNRNCVHSFQEREIGTWEELFSSIKFFCALVSELVAMTPDVDDYLSIEAEMRAEYEAEIMADMDY